MTFAAERKRERKRKKKGKKETSVLIFAAKRLILLLQNWLAATAITVAKIK